MKTNRAFTLIELLVVISIIGVLATLALVSFGPAQKQAKDTKRKSDLKQIRTALELYYNDYGYYPLPSSCGGLYDNNCYSYSTGGDDWIPGLAQYMNGKVPVDPKNTGGAPWGSNGYTYSYGNVGRYTNPGKFDLTAHLENPNDSDRCEIKNWKWWFDGRPWCTAWTGSYSNQIYEDSPN